MDEDIYKTFGRSLEVSSKQIRSLYILQDQKQQIVAKKDAIEKGLLNNIQNMEPENQKDVKTQVNDYKDQVVEFDKTVKQIGQLNKTLKKSNINTRQQQQQMAKSREQNKF